MKERGEMTILEHSIWSVRFFGILATVMVNADRDIVSSATLVVVAAGMHALLEYKNAMDQRKNNHNSTL